MEEKKLVLASKSPRRKYLLEEIGLSFKIITNEVEEVYPDEMNLREVPEYLSVLKAKAVLSNIEADEIIIACDTIVLMDGIIYGKPGNREESIKMLTKLSGKMHEVISGVCLLSKNKQHTFAETTKVYFKRLNTNDIVRYIDEYEPYDKAGSYGIQEWIGMIGIEKIEGDYFNVVGLPVSKFYSELKAF